MSELIHLDQHRDTNPELVPFLTEMLARAQRGELDMVAFAAVKADGGFLACVTAADDTHLLRLCGAIADVQYMAARALNES